MFGLGEDLRLAAPLFRKLLGGKVAYLRLGGDHFGNTCSTTHSGVSNEGAPGTTSSFLFAVLTRNIALITWWTRATPMPGTWSPDRWLKRQQMVALPATAPTLPPNSSFFR